MDASAATANEVLEFWFGVALDDPQALHERNRAWFTADPAFDAEVRGRFDTLVERARAGDLRHWGDSARTSLALVVTLDQFPRNIHRGTPEAFSCDGLALAACTAGLERGFDRALHPVEALFYYLPLQHAEDAAAQARSCALCDALVERTPGPLRDFVAQCAGYAHLHREIVERFGRFPHRNTLLGRTATAAETAWLAEGGQTFGQGEAPDPEP
jgi:uncharacterized protein (DUF924 family)